MISPEELHHMQNRLTAIASHPNVSAEDARYAMTAALQLLGEVRRLQSSQHPAMPSVERMQEAVRAYHAAEEAKYEKPA